MIVRRLTTAAHFIATILAALCYLGAIRSSAVWAYVLPGTVIAVVATFLPRKSDSYAGLISGLGSGMVWAIIVNGLSGENMGPVARSTTVCIIGVTLVAFGMRRREPTTSMIGHLFILFGALYYGAANEVWKLAVVATIFQLAGYIGTSIVAQRRQPQHRSRREYLSLLILLLVSIIIVLTTPWKLPGILQRDDPQVSSLVVSSAVRPPWASSPGTDTAITPTTLSTISTATTTTTTTTTTAVPPTVTLNPNIDPLSTTTTTATTATTTTTTITETPNTTTPQVTTTTNPETVKKKKDEEESCLWFWILLVILMIILITLSRLLYVRIKNLSLLRQHATEDNRESIRLAWNWTLANLIRYRYNISASVSLDRVASSQQVTNWPANMQINIGVLAELAEVAIFSDQPMSEEDKESAWSSSAVLIDDARKHSSRFRRIVAPFVRVRL